ncbi:hypothetical protein [Mucilaginibacter agri]|uniref:Uncharacterized protein n=1 Tax=Mucilaginibacter agri TaxID=2695265 RepID=A0A965ZI76_9SPHI|nr:hypothetical protein [Mucilaginibacter agri]NCD71505.1 hypothetical protein [Mucilaginibacter agri]
MKSLDLHQNAFSSFPAKLVALRHKLALRNPVQLHLPKVNLQLNAVSGNAIKTYVVDALNEGLKQNLLGADINMEFLVLSIRSYAQALVSLTRVNTAKPLSNAQPIKSGSSFFDHNNHSFIN